MKFKVCIILVLSAALLSSCSAFGVKTEGTIVNKSEPDRERTARADIEFNKAMENLVKSYGSRGKINQAKLNLSIADFKKAIEIDPGNIETYRQLGIIYEILKRDMKTARKYYSLYREHGGKNAVILDALKR